MTQVGFNFLRQVVPRHGVGSEAGHQQPNKLRGQIEENVQRDLDGDLAFVTQAPPSEGDSRQVSQKVPVTAVKV
ncbi:MAG: hypothetical protein FJZ63_03395 [Chlamydiae bacterium]|nr:hypothetical protein [Chlamydiota bacterium]